MKFVLYDFIEGGLSKIYPKTSTDGKTYTNRVKVFVPGKEYNTSDEIVMKWVKGEIPGAETDSIATPALKEALAVNGIAFSASKCGNCANAQVHYTYNPFRIIEE